MAEGSLTAWFGEDLAFTLFRRVQHSRNGVDADADAYRIALGDLNGLTLMKRVNRIAEALGTVLPPDAASARDLVLSMLPPPLGPSGKTFNDGYWVLPLAAYWPAYHLEEPEIALPALREITKRGTAEFAVRPFVELYPTWFATVLEDWIGDASFHVRRLASEGTRPYLPWGGRLKVSKPDGARFFEIIRALGGDDSAYVRRSVGNHARDWRRIDESIVDGWLHGPHGPAIPADVRKLAEPR